MPRRTGLTLVEVLIVVVLMSIVAAVVVVQFTDVVAETKVDVARHSLFQMRVHIERYKGTHGSSLPSATLVELVSRTNTLGQIGSDDEHRYGPYIQVIPKNPLTSSNQVVEIFKSPASADDVVSTAGWLYNPVTAELWISHPDHYSE